MYKIKTGDCLESLRTLPNNSIQCCVTSPPYFNLRDYGIDGQIGRENAPKEYIQRLVDVFEEVRRVLKPDGTLWVNIGDSWNNSSKSSDGLKPKDLIGIPWMLAFALRDAGWYLRQDIIWQKPNAMPESVKDRCVKSHEYVFLFSKSEKYYFDYKAIQEDATNAGKVVKLGEKSFSKGQAKGAGVKESGSALQDTYTVKDKRNRRSVWSVTTKPIKDAHFAPYPPDLIQPCILAGTKEGDWVIDPFGGSGTTTIVCETLKRNSILLELNPEYVEIAKKRIESNCG